jgi:hypothetical protein
MPEFLMEKMEAELTFAEYDPDLFRLFGITGDSGISFTMKGLAKSVSGIALGTTTIDLSEVISWSYTESKREEYTKVTNINYWKHKFNS